MLTGLYTPPHIVKIANEEWGYQMGIFDAAALALAFRLGK